MIRIAVIGSLPPPFTGQNIQTLRNSELIGRHFEVSTIDTSTGAAELNDERPVLSRLKHYAALRSAIRTTLERLQADAVVWHTVSPQIAGHLRDTFAVVPSIPPGTPLYAVVHWGNFDKLFRRLTTTATARRLVRRCTAFVFLDESLATRCSEWIPDEKRLVIPNTIDEALIPDAAAIAKKISRFGSTPTHSKKTILFVANMIPSKGYMELLDSLPALVKSEVGSGVDSGVDTAVDSAVDSAVDFAEDFAVDFAVDFVARFVGKWISAADEKAFHERVKALGLEGRIDHVGQITDRSELARLYLEADVFVLPTYYPTEAQPLSVIEAIAAATPVVVSRHASLPSMVTAGKEARFVDPTKSAEISAAIKGLLQPTVWPAAAAAARARFDKTFAPDIVAEQWHNLLAPDKRRS
jgi:glycosyltransferase involved in cell wall biosynthesis